MKIDAHQLFLASLTFFIGYFFWYWMVPVPSIIMPELTGKPLSEAFSLAAESSISLFLLKKEMNNQLPEGLVINQIPAAGTMVKIHRPCFITITIQETATQINCINLPVETIKKKCDEKGIKPTFYYLPCSHAQQQACFAQIPSPQEPILDKKIICYIATSKTETLIMPSLNGLTKKELFTLATEQAWELKIVYAEREYSNDKTEQTIVDQRPFAGSIYHQNKNLLVQVLLQKTKE
jgi:beta-lactam-binding protein with PASTA domain